MRSAPNARDKIKIADVVMNTNHVTFLTIRFPRLISLPTSAIFVSGTSGITAILKYRNVNPINSFSDLQSPSFSRPLETVPRPLIKIGITYGLSLSKKK